MGKRGGEILFYSNLFLILILGLIHAPFMPYNRQYADAPSLLGDNRGRVQTIHMMDRGKGIDLVRQGDSWNLLMPDNQGGSLQYPADQERVGKFLDGLESARKYYTVVLSEEKAGRLGLAGVQNETCDCLQIQLTGENNTNLGRLFIGKLDGSETPIVVKGEELIYLVPDRIRSMAGNGDPLFFRSRDLFSPELDAKRFRTIRVALSGKKDVEISRSGERWQIISPVTGQARSAEMETLVRDLSSLKIRKFLSSPPDKIDRSQAMDIELILDGQVGEMETKHIRILGATESGEYVIPGESKEWYLVSDFYLEKFFHVKETLLENSSPVPGNSTLMEQ